MEKQVYLNVGTLLLGASTLGIDAIAIEGFNSAVLDKEHKDTVAQLSCLKESVESKTVMQIYRSRDTVQTTYLVNVNYYNN